jgi:hypothetical protein
MATVLPLLSLIGDSDQNDCHINLGSHIFDDYVIELPEELSDSAKLTINAENCSIAFSCPSGKKHFESVRICSVRGIKFNGGANISRLEVYSCKVEFEARDEIDSVVVASKNPDCEDDEAIKRYLKGICFGHGTGEGVFGRDGTASRALIEIKEYLPAVKWLNPIVAWHADSINIKTCKVGPGIEREEERELWTLPVAEEGIHTHLISRIDGSVNSGRTYYDREVLETFGIAKSLGFKLCFTPSILVDTPGKPWRGEITGEVEDVDRFFVEQYRPFILHYATILRGLVDGFVIGSELKGLTKIHTLDRSHFPFVERLVDLAREVKSIVGKDCRVTYSGTYDEYHHTDGGLRPMDMLWSCRDIDVVGINGYFPLTTLKSSSLSVVDVKAGLSSGEGYDYWMDGKGVQHPLSSEWAVKRVGCWWGGPHYSGGTRTHWEPECKKVWITEFGAASLDKSTNNPGLSYVPGGSLPPASTGHISIVDMLRTIRGYLEYYSGTSYCSGLFAYYYDARGEGWHLDERWADRHTWWYSHGIEGKLYKTERVEVRGVLKAARLMISAPLVIFHGDAMEVPRENIRIVS